VIGKPTAPSTTASNPFRPFDNSISFNTEPNSSDECAGEGQFGEETSDPEILPKILNVHENPSICKPRQLLTDTCPIFAERHRCVSLFEEWPMSLRFALEGLSLFL
jgi:hypothetical protein